MKLTLIVAALAVFSGTTAFAGFEELTVGGKKLTEIRTVVRTAPDKVTIRCTEGFVQVEVAKLPQDFLSAWKVEQEPAPAGQFLPSKELFKIVRPLVFDANSDNNPATYALEIIEGTFTLQLSITSEKKRKDGQPASLCLVSVKTSAVDDFLKAIERFKTYANTDEERPQIVGKFGGADLYYKPPIFLTYGVGLGGSNSSLLMMTFGENTPDGVAYLPLPDVERVRAIFQGWRNGGDYSEVSK